MKMPRHFEYFVLLLVLLLGALVRVLYFEELKDRPQFTLLHLDGKYHDQMARAGTPGAQPDAESARLRNQYARHPYFRPPGYVYFLGGVYRLFGPRYAAPRLVQFGLGLLNVFLAWWLYRRIFSKRYSLLAALFASLYWIFVYYEGTLYETTWFTFLLLLLAVALVHLQRSPTWRTVLPTGVVFAAGVLTRPNLLACALPIVGWIWLAARPAPPARRWAAGAWIFLAAALAAISPVTMRNYLCSGERVLVSANAGINLYAGNNEKSDGYSPGGPLLGFWDCFDYASLCARIGQQAGRPLTYSGTSAYLSREALHYAFRHPARTLALTGKKALLFWGPREVGNEEEEELERSDSRVLSRLPGRFPIVAALFAAGAILCFLPARHRLAADRLEQRSLAILLLWIVLFYFLTYLPFIVAARYRTSLIPYLLLFAVAAIGRIVDLFRSRQWRQAIFWLAFIGAATFLFSRNFAGYQPRQAEWHTLRATRFGRTGQLDAAIAECRAAIAAAPGFPEAWRLLGHAYLSKGDEPQAIESYRQAARLDPLDSASRHNLACLLRENPEQLAEATAMAREACENRGYLNPGTMGILADCYVRQGNASQAVAVLRQAIQVAQSNDNAAVARQLQDQLNAIDAAK